jgi:hypothetical protein
MYRLRNQVARENLYHGMPFVKTSCPRPAPRLKRQTLKKHGFLPRWPPALVSARRAEGQGPAMPPASRAGPPRLSMAIFNFQAADRRPILALYYLNRYLKFQLKTD